MTSLSVLLEVVSNLAPFGYVLAGIGAGLTWGGMYLEW